MIPVRVKIIGILTLALVGSLGCFLWIGSSTFYQDKSAYIYDYNLTQTQLAAGRIENQIKKVALGFQIMDSHALTDTAGLEAIYKKAKLETGLRRLLILGVTPLGTLEPAWSIQDDDHRMIQVLDQLGWDTMRFQAEPVLIGRTSNGELAIGALSRLPDGSKRVYLALAESQLHAENGADGEFQIFLLDDAGEPLFSNSKKAPHANLAKILDALQENHFPSGVRHWNAKESYLVAYQRLSLKKLTVVGLISEKKAFSGIETLLYKSIALGFGILLLASGFTLIFVKSIIEGLRQMAAVTEKVTQGDFDFRVDTRKMKNDEIGLLARSFNAMAGKIADLMSAVEVKVETKNQLEQTESVQTNLFPTEAFNHPNFNLMGKTIFSPVCSGDWWHYEKVGDYALMVVGKIENRGLTAAMLTAVVRGAISTFVSTTKILPQNMAPIFKLLVNHLNSAIYDCTRGKEKMKCFIGILDLRSGKLTSINCDFTPPLLHRIRFGGRPENYEDRFVRLASGAGVALGSTNKMEIVPVVNQLSPGDMIFWYSPQITEKVNLHKTLGKAWDDYGCQSKRLVEKTMETVSSSLGKSAQSPPDDLTLVVATVPKEAYFVQAEAEKAA